VAFNDATCPRCKQKIRWMGDLKDRPPCKCGHQLTEAELQEMKEVEEELDRIRSDLLKDE
jgi:hypothetical protein